MLLEEPYFTDSLRRNATCRNVSHCPAFEFEPRVRDVYFVGEHWNSHRFHFRNWLADKCQQNVQVVNHQIVDDVHIQAARRKDSESMYFEKQRTIQNRFHS